MSRVGWNKARLRRALTLMEYVKRAGQELADEVDPDRNYDDDSGILGCLQGMYSRADAGLMLIEVDGRIAYKRAWAGKAAKVVP